MLNKSSQSAGAKRQQPPSGRSASANDSLVIDRCPECHVVLESYDDDTVSLCIVCLATFIHREPALAAPLLLDMLHAVSRYLLLVSVPLKRNHHLYGSTSISTTCKVYE